MIEDRKLLRQYVQQGSQAAFSQLVARHLNFVYSVCWREISDPVLAEDTTQVVFLLLAKKAPSLRVETTLSGWLFQTARFASRNARRREEHRKSQEQNAGAQMLSADTLSVSPGGDGLWENIRPLLNEALASLGAKDREAVLLRFADGYSFPELGSALGTSEDAARMRPNRAVARLQQFFAQKGVTLSALVLTGLLADRSVQAAPAACVAAVDRITRGIGPGGNSEASVNSHIHSQFQGILKAMTITKIKLAAAVAASIVIGGSLPFVTRAQDPSAATHQGTKEQASNSGEARPDTLAVLLLKQMVAAYQALQTYSGTEIAQGTGGLGAPYEMNLTYQRPGQMVAEVTRPEGNNSITSHLLLDSKTQYVNSSGKPNQYTRRTQPENEFTLWEDGLIIREGIHSPIIMEMLEQGDRMEKYLTQVGPSTILSLGPLTTVDGVPVDTVVMKTQIAQDTSTEVWQIGHADHLLRRHTQDSQANDHYPFHTIQTFLSVRANPTLPASTFVFTAPPGAVVTDVGPGGANADPAAVALLTRMYSAYEALKSFSCDMEVTTHGLIYGPNGTMIGTAPVISRSSYAIQKPYRAVMTRTNSDYHAQAISDGSTLYVTTTQPDSIAAKSSNFRVLPGRYLRLPLQATPGYIIDNLSNFGGLPDAGNCGQQMFLPLAVFGAQVMRADRLDWKMGQPGTVNGEPVDTVTLRQDMTNDTGYSIMTLAISRNDHLLRQVIQEYHYSHQPTQQEFDTFTHLQINPTFSASRFVFTPPPGSQPVSVASQMIALH